MADIKITGVETGPPPPKAFQPTFFKGKDEKVLASDNRLKSAYITKSLLDGVTLSKDLKLY